MQMRLITGRANERRGLHFHKAAIGKKRSQRRDYAHATQQERPPVRMRGSAERHGMAPCIRKLAVAEGLANGSRLGKVQVDLRPRNLRIGTPIVKVIASSLRKGNIVEHEG